MFVLIIRHQPHKPRRIRVCKCEVPSQNLKRRQLVAECLQLWEYIPPLTSMQSLNENFGNNNKHSGLTWATSLEGEELVISKVLLSLWEMNTVGGVSLSSGQRRKSQCLVYHGICLLWTSDEGEGHANICVPILQACTVEMSHLVFLCNMIVYNIKHENNIIFQLQASSSSNFSEVPFISTGRIAVNAVQTSLTSAEFSLNMR